MTPSAGNEVELKLAVHPDDLPRLEAHPLLRGRAKRRTLVSAYFDTPNGRLREAGFSLRIRSDGPRRVQTIKVLDGASAGLFQRSEWEQGVHASRPDRESLKDTPLDTLLADEAAIKALRPLFTVKVVRTIHLLEQDGAEVEVALDRGGIEADGRTEPLLELELELKRGSPEALFALAARLFEAPPLRLSTASKAQAGFAMLRPAKSSSKAKAVALTRGMTTEQAFQAIGRACLSHFAKNEPRVRLDRSPEALHQARIALRRLRAAMSLFGPLIADEQSQTLRAELRRVAGVLGEARDLDVFRQGLEAGDGAGHLAAELEGRRTAAYDRAVRMLGAPPGSRLTFEIAAWLEAGCWRASEEERARALRAAPIAAFAAEVLARRRARVRKQAPRLRKLTPEDRHEVRIEVKKLRYAAEFFEGLAEGKSRKRARAFADALRPLQEALGELNDLATQEVMAAAMAPDLAEEAAERRRRDEPAALDQAEAAAIAFAETKSFLRREARAATG